jgi:hypothetical protein
MPTAVTGEMLTGDGIDEDHKGGHPFIQGIATTCTQGGSDCYSSS